MKGQQRGKNINVYHKQLKNVIDLKLYTDVIEEYTGIPKIEDRTDVYKK